MPSIKVMDSFRVWVRPRKKELLVQCKARNLISTRLRRSLRGIAYSIRIKRRKEHPGGVQMIKNWRNSIFPTLRKSRRELRKRGKTSSTWSATKQTWPIVKVKRPKRKETLSAKGSTWSFENRRSIDLPSWERSSCRLMKAYSWRVSSFMPTWVT